MNLTDAAGLALFSGMGVFMSVVAGLYRRMRGRLEERVAERTATLDEANAQLEEEIAERQAAQESLASLMEEAVAERKRAEREREIAVQFLGLINTSAGLPDLIAAATGFFHEHSGCEAVGMRLKAGDDFPYYETRGFPPEFVQAENSLCRRDAGGQMQRDAAGNPLIECMCGNVICGRFDPAKPFFTPAGSFWTNCTTQLLASTTEADRQAPHPQPLQRRGLRVGGADRARAGDERLGLLQLNDKRPGRFTPELIALWERLGDYLAVAIAKARAEEALRESEQRRKVAAAVERSGSVSTTYWR